MAEIGQRAKVKVSQLGKWKTSVQMISIAMLLYRDDLFGIPVNDFGHALLYLAAVLTLWSMINYLKAALIAIGEQ
jgi:phosphatidylglycerophosphate synthase